MILLYLPWSFSVIQISYTVLGMAGFAITQLLDLRNNSARSESREKVHTN